ncbi:hypothetical protein [Limnohabitans planktonicus]|uniref:hypothetical protein n=1 Tax=Limnohabitans planktonicus TaxID=540060 RepID=UPI000A47C825|nr:hypothetical protein [Limnohabitans planktonicus]
MNLFNRRQSLTLLGAAVLVPSVTPVLAQAATPSTTAWPDTERAARGQTVYFNAWAGSERINAYLQWVAGELQRDFGVKLQHVKISDAADVVKRVRAEKQAGRKDTEGTVDLIWINGENFAAMKRDGLLSAPFALLIRPCEVCKVTSILQLVGASPAGDQTLVDHRHFAGLASVHKILPTGNTQLRLHRAESITLSNFQWVDTAGKPTTLQTRRRLARPAAPVGVCACARTAHPGGAGHTRRTRRGRPAARGALARRHRRKPNPCLTATPKPSCAPR